MDLDNTPNSLSVVISFYFYGCEPLLHLATTYVGEALAFSALESVLFWDRREYRKGASGYRKEAPVKNY